ncbi:MAG: transposase [Rivularia sp. (in: cyanobacteria)]
MAKISTPSFITELPLKVDSKQQTELLARFQAARQLYNACLSEALIRMELVRNQEAYQQAKKLRGGNKKERQNLFIEARKNYRFSEYDLGSFGTATANNSKWMSKKLGAHEKINMGFRAFKAVDKILFGMAKGVRFKPANRFKSVEGKSNATGLRFVKNHVLWKKLTIEPIIDWSNPVITHGLNSPIKYCRILWRNINDKKRWYIQLINEGLPYQKPQNYVRNGTIGLDLNISNVAFVGDDYAGLLPFAKKVPTYERELKALQRKMQRSQRLHNPENFELDFDKKVGNKVVRKKGKVKPGKKQWIKTRNYRRIQVKKADIERKKSAYGKSQNRKLVNEILRHGNRIKTENVSVKGWHKRYGKAISAKSPGFFQSELARKAESAGGQFVKFSTQKTALSQTHLDGTRIKKKLSERVHRDVTGIQPMHRDLWSAYLARCVYGDVLSLRDAQWEYSDTEPYLLEAWQRYRTNCKQVAERERKGSHSPSEQFSNKVLNLSQIANRGDKLG